MLTTIVAFQGAFVIVVAKLFGYAILGLALLALVVVLFGMTVDLFFGRPLAKLPKLQVRQRDDRGSADLDHGPTVLGGASERHRNAEGRFRC